MFFAARKSLLLAVGVAVFGAWTAGCRQEGTATTAEGAAETRSDAQTATNPPPRPADDDAPSTLTLIPPAAAEAATPLLVSPPRSTESPVLQDAAGSASSAKTVARPADGLASDGPTGEANRLPASDGPSEPGSDNAPRILPAVGAMPVTGSSTTFAANDESVRLSIADDKQPDDGSNPLRRGNLGADRRTDQATAQRPHQTPEWSSGVGGSEPAGRFAPAAPAPTAPAASAGPPSAGLRSPADGSAWENSPDQSAGAARRPTGPELRGFSPIGLRPSDQQPSSARLAAESSSSAVRLSVGSPSREQAAAPGSTAAAGAGDRGDKPAPPKRKGKHSGEHFDPIKENGPIFEGWPKPQLALVITGREEGYIEPCGCAGLDRMKGGMARRQTLFRSLKKQGWEVVGLDVGGLARGFGKQAELKFQTMVEAKRRTGYDAVALGTTDLRLPAGELAAVAATADGTPSMFVATNVGLFGFDAAVAPRSKVIERPGARLGVMAVVGKQTQQAIHNDEIEMIDAESAIRQMLPDLKKKSGYLVLLAHMPTEEAEALARKFPEINLVATSGGPAEPPAKLSFVEGTKTILVEVGEKGMNAVVIGFFDDPKTPVRYQRVPLDARFESSSEMKSLLAAYQDQLRTLGWAGLNIRALPHPQTETNGKFIGSKKCESCHEESNKVWKRTGHSRAFATLENLDPPRHHDPECVSCHVIGWHPTKYFPYQNGFVSKEKTPELIDVGCESCHGPGEKHAAAEIGADLELQKRLRQAMVVTKEESAKRQCYTCHDLDNSPDFEFESYWPIVEHYED